MPCIAFYCIWLVCEIFPSITHTLLARKAAALTWQVIIGLPDQFF